MKVWEVNKYEMWVGLKSFCVVWFCFLEFCSCFLSVAVFSFVAVEKKERSELSWIVGSRGTRKYELRGRTALRPTTSALRPPPESHYRKKAGCLFIPSALLYERQTRIIPPHVRDKSNGRLSEGKAGSIVTREQWRSGRVGGEQRRSHGIFPGSWKIFASCKVFN